MLSAKYRVPKTEIFRVIRQGKKVPGEFFGIKIWFEDKLNHPLFAIVVSTKIDKRAVVRNTIKRKFRAALYSIVNSQELKKGYYVFLVRDVKVKDIKSQDLAEQLFRILLVT